MIHVNKFRVEVEASPKGQTTKAADGGKKYSLYSKDLAQGASRLVKQLELNPDESARRYVDYTKGVVDISYQGGELDTVRSQDKWDRLLMGGLPLSRTAYVRFKNGKAIVADHGSGPFWIYLLATAIIKKRYSLYKSKQELAATARAFKEKQN